MKILSVETRTGNDWFVEWGGGYYYPDLFALERPNRWQPLAREARRTWAMMTNHRHADHRLQLPRAAIRPTPCRAYEVFARETDGLLAILVFQYNPYEAGAGKTFWVKDGPRHGRPRNHRPLFHLGAHNNQRPRSGTPAKVAREIRESVAAALLAELPRYDWAITHVWSYFRHGAGHGRGSREFPARGHETPPAAPEGGIRGYTPVVCAAERLPQSIGVVSPPRSLPVRSA